MKQPTPAGIHVQPVGNVTLATLDLSREDRDAYYLGYANDVLWPVFHCRPDLANFDTRFAAGEGPVSLEPMPSHISLI
nr:hypothetical protein [Paraburkholderia lacunae]